LIHLAGGNANFLKLFYWNLQRRGKDIMKTPRFQISIVMAAAIGTLILIVSTALAESPKRFGQFRHSDREASDRTSTKLRHNRSAKTARPAPPVRVPPGYPRYRLIDLGTFGGANSGVWGASIQLNNRGQVIAQFETTIPDPFCAECFIVHGGVREVSGVITDLGALPGTNSSIPVWISGTGLIAGLSQNGLVDPLFDFPEFRAVLWNHDHSIIDLGTLGGNGSAAYSVNSRSQVVGVAANTLEENPDFASFIAVDFPSATQARAFRWQNGAMQDLGTLGGNDASATTVNERGQIVGFSYTNTTPNDTTGVPTIHPFLWENGSMRDLGSLGGTLAKPGSFTFLGGSRVLNDVGEVAGTSMLEGDEILHAFVWSNGSITDLGTLGGTTSEALAINNRSQVVGRARVSDAPVIRHPFIWEDGHMTDLGMVSPCINGTAFGINNQGKIVGSLSGCTDDPGDITFETAFYVEKGQPMADLNTLITPSSSNIHVVDAWNVNDRGEIFGNGKLPDGSERAVLLVPINRP
jgi:probable HAF family extracellular repeat protein